MKEEPGHFAETHHAMRHFTLVKFSKSSAGKIVEHQNSKAPFILNLYQVLGSQKGYTSIRNAVAVGRTYVASGRQVFRGLLDQSSPFAQELCCRMFYF